jgi:type II secretory pathway component GspD/PulD (secretin)
MKLPAQGTLLAACASLGLLASCAPVLPPGFEGQLRTGLTEAARSAQALAEVRETDEPFINARVVEYLEPGRNGVSVRLVQAPLGEALQAIARPRGFGVAFVGNARAQARVTIEVSNLAFAAAARELALAAGLVAVIDERRQQVLVAEEATYVFRLPPFLVERQRTNWSVQSNPGPASGGDAGAGGPGSFAGAGGASPAGGAVAAPGATRTGGTTTVVQGSAARSADALVAALNAIAGGPSGQRVQYLPESSLVQVRGNAVELRRARELLDLVIREGQQQVQVEAAFVEVSLTRQFQYGIDWQKVMSGIGALGTGTSIQLQAGGGASVSQPALQASFTGRSVRSVIQVLDSLGGARVVARPSVVTRNHADAVLYRGRQVPYLAEVNQQAVANVGTSTGARVDFVPEGTSLALRASVVDGAHVDLRLEPTQIQGVTFQQFSFGQNAMVQAPNYPLSQAHISLLVESGKTYVIGGLGLESTTSSEQGVPGASQLPVLRQMFTSSSHEGERTQLVLLLTAHILPGPGMVDSLVGESL